MICMQYDAKCMTHANGCRHNGHCGPKEKVRTPVTHGEGVRHPHTPKEQSFQANLARMCGMNAILCHECFSMLKCVLKMS